MKALLVEIAATKVTGNLGLCVSLSQAGLFSQEGSGEEGRQFMGCVGVAGWCQEGGSFSVFWRQSSVSASSMGSRPFFSAFASEKGDLLMWGRCMGFQSLWWRALLGGAEVGRVSRVVPGPGELTGGRGCVWACVSRECGCIAVKASVALGGEDKVITGH